MVQLGFMNALDLFLLFVLFIGLLIGLMRGPVPQIISLGSIWLGLLFSLWTYKLFSKHILQGIGLTGIPADTIAFLILLVVMFNIIRLVIKSLATPPEEKKKKPKKKGTVGPADEESLAGKKLLAGPFHTIGGMVMGIILTTIWFAILLGVMQFSFQVQIDNVLGVESGVSSQGISNQLRGSTLVPYFNRVLWLLVTSLKLFMFDPGADILSRVVKTLTLSGGGS